MPYGYADRILRVNLTTGKIWAESPGEAFFRKYLGGSGVVSYYLWKLLKPRVEPLSPDNVLVIAPGVVTGAAASGQGRNSVGAKSPLTGAWASAEAGGYFGYELKRAGVDAIVFEGKAAAPVYLWVHDGKAELRQAKHLWGMTVGDAEDALRQELGNPRVKTCLIGPAGENLVRYACVVNDRNRFAGRGGLGAVMGSKNLKAVATVAPHGTGLMSIYDMKEVTAVQRWIGSNLDTVKNYYEHGTMGGLMTLNVTGGLPTRNFQQGSFELAAQISGQKMTDEILTRRDTCAACAVRCKRVVEMESPYKIDGRYGGPEYESISSLGNNCGIADLPFLAKQNEQTAALGVDTISLGVSIAFAMECYERGIITKEDTGGLELTFGNMEVMEKLVQMVARREGFGDVVAEGVARMVERFGEESREFAMVVKNQELPMHEPRIKHALGLGYAISPTGADHMHNMHDTGFTRENHGWRIHQEWGPTPTISQHGFDENKMQLFYNFTNFRHGLNCMVMCHFLSYPPSVHAQLVRGTTGWKDFDHFELREVGRRAATMARMFNVREGFSEQDDALPRRFHQALRDSATGAAIDESDFYRARRDYYEKMGWDGDTGVPTRQGLAALGLEYMAI